MDSHCLSMVSQPMSIYVRQWVLRRLAGGKLPGRVRVTATVEE